MSTESLENVLRRSNEILSVCRISTDYHIGSPHADFCYLSVFSKRSVFNKVDDSADSILHFLWIVAVVASERFRICVHFLANVRQVLFVFFDADVGPDRQSQMGRTYLYSLTIDFLHGVKRVEMNQRRGERGFLR